jgi:glutamate dehydrogenase/leucine dehydrogenase
VSSDQETPREYRERLERELDNARRNLAGWRAQVQRTKGPALLDLRVWMGDAEQDIRRLQAALIRLHQRSRPRVTPEQEDTS